MLLIISSIVSFIIVMLIILLAPIPYKKKPMMITLVVAELVLLFSYITTQTLSIGIGVLFFIGLLFCSAILVGKRRAWLIQNELLKLKQVPKRSLHKEMKHFEHTSARSIYEEEKSPLYVQKSAKLSESTNEEVQIEVIDSVIPPAQEVVIEQQGDHVMEHEDLILEAAATEHTNIYEMVETKKEPIQIVDSEELSDEWMNRRVESLFANEETIKEETSVLDEVELEEIMKSNVNDFSIVDDKPETEKKIDTEFEDLSSVYFNKQRSDDGGTKE